VSEFFDTEQPVTVHVPTETTDAYGNTNYGPPYTDIPASFYAVVPVSSTEYTGGRQTLTTAVVGYAPADSIVNERCEVSSLGKRYRVIGIVPVPDMDDPSKVDCLKVDLEGAG
jgi:hypothetical protein